MKGLNATTGRVTSGLAHLYQSIGKILSTPLGTRIARRDFGSELPDLIDAPNNGAVRVRLYAAVAGALMRWEPRLNLTRVQLIVDATAAIGAQELEIEGTATATGEPVSTRVSLPTGGTT